MGMLISILLSSRLLHQETAPRHSMWSFGGFPDGNGSFSTEPGRRWSVGHSFSVSLQYRRDLCNRPIRLIPSHFLLRFLRPLGNVEYIWNEKPMSLYTVDSPNRGFSNGEKNDSANRSLQANSHLDRNFILFTESRQPSLQPIGICGQSWNFSMRLHGFAWLVEAPRVPGGLAAG